MHGAEDQGTAGADDAEDRPDRYQRETGCVLAGFPGEEGRRGGPDEGPGCRCQGRPAGHGQGDQRVQGDGGESVPGPEREDGRAGACCP